MEMQERMSQTPLSGKKIKIPEGMVMDRGMRQ